MPRRSVREVLTFSQPSHSSTDRPFKHDSPVASETALDVRRQIRESLGLPSRPEAQPRVPVEGHVCDFPLWSYSKKRSRETELRIDYEDGSFLMLDASKGMPSPRFPGYLDAILFYGQRDLFLQDHTTLSVYSIFQTLGMNAGDGRNYAHFHRDMNRVFRIVLVTDRFRNPATGQRSHVDHFRVMRRMKLAKSRREVSLFWFDDGVICPKPQKGIFHGIYIF